ncbi:hypothetical protein ERJ75_001367300 [Trypanosoma vivax]|uniref:Uncharacterized protein n=1 Tax=Trypanosoma vivax (strain Y486) TaxID=1055687 RepID=G0UCH6_TRYVY|nr:hypothetical protein ERJ75_001367300 [Trypanosoma vivax]CCC53536.1 conserved hypothetical protein [Trypanosoma vivax Y486]
MDICVGVVAEDEEAARVACGAVERGCEPLFMNNDGPFLDVWFGESMLYGLVERVAPSDLTQAACAAGCGADHGTRALRVTSSVPFVLRLSSVPHGTLGPRPLSEDPFVGCARTVVDYAAQLRRGARAEFVGADAGGEYVRFSCAPGAGAS